MADGRQAILGASTSPTIDQLASAGSFGDFITLRRSEGEERKFGLTCWHVVRPMNVASAGIIQIIRTFVMEYN